MGNLNYFVKSDFGKLADFSDIKYYLDDYALSLVDADSLWLDEEDERQAPIEDFIQKYRLYLILDGNASDFFNGLDASIESIKNPGISLEQRISEKEQLLEYLKKPEEFHTVESIDFEKLGLYRELEDIPEDQKAQYITLKTIRNGKYSEELTNYESQKKEYENEIAALKAELKDKSPDEDQKQVLSDLENLRTHMLSKMHVIPPDWNIVKSELQEILQQNNVGDFGFTNQIKFIDMNSDWNDASKINGLIPFFLKSYNILYDSTIEKYQPLKESLRSFADKYFFIDLPLKKSNWIPKITVQDLSEHNRLSEPFYLLTTKQPHEKLYDIKQILRHPDLSPHGSFNLDLYKKLLRVSADFDVLGLLQELNKQSLLNQTNLNILIDFDRKLQNLADSDWKSLCSSAMQMQSILPNSEKEHLIAAGVYQKVASFVEQKFENEIIAHRKHHKKISSVFSKSGFLDQLKTCDFKSESLKAIEESAEDLIDQKKIKGSQKETLRSFILQIKQLSRKIVCEKDPGVNAAYEATIAGIKADIEANWKIKPGKEGNKPKVETSSAYVQRVYAYLLNEQERPAWEVFLKVITEKDTHSSPFFNKLCASTKVKAFKERIRSELGQIPVDAGTEKICEQLEVYRKQFDLKSLPSQASVEMQLPRGVRGGR